jgi:hypothetical protein
MSMKRLLTIAALCAPLSCVANQGAAFVRFLNARGFTPASPTCSTQADLFKPSGALDVAGDDNYLMAVSIETNTAAQPITINQIPFQGSGLSDVTLYEIVYSYDFSDPDAGISLPKEESAPIYAVFRPNAAPTDNYVLMNGIGPQALTALQTYYRSHQRKTDPASPTRTVPNEGILISHIKAKAYLSGSEETETNIFRFPITISASSYDPNTATGCSAPGAVLVSNSNCGYLGQDGPICTK